MFVAFVGGGGEAALRGTHSQAALGNDRDAERGEAELRGTHSQAELGNDKDGQWRPEDESNIRLVLRRDPLYPLSYRGVIMQINN